MASPIHNPVDTLPAHSSLGASSYSRWKACPGSVRLCEGIPNRSSVYAAEGTMAHELAHRILTNQPREDMNVTTEMLDAVMVYVDYVNKRLKSLKPTGVMFEEKFNLTKYHPKLYGTADCVIYWPTEALLEVIDYKHGMGVPVDVIKDNKPNVQLLYYALGALHAIQKTVSRIRITVVQPRCFHPDGPIRSTGIDFLDLIDFANELITDAKATEDPNAPIIPGAHCRWCAAQPICPELHKKSLALAKQEFSPVFSYDPEKLSNTLSYLPMLEGFIKSVREFAYREAEQGRCPPGYKLVEKRAIRKWLPGAEKALGHKFSLHQHQTHDVKLKSPAQIEKILPANLRSQLDALTIKESSGKSLVADSDSRQNISHGARDVFDPIED